MKLVLIHPGSFTMGSPVGEVGRKENETPHEVTISKSYYLGIYEVTQGEYEKVMGKNPSRNKGVRLPVEEVTWLDADTFCSKLSEMPDEKSAGRQYRLPTEAEWEYACRAKNRTAFSFADSAEWLEEFAWSCQKEGNIHPVGEKKPNSWGLYDMHGNVWEWCEDWFGDYPIDDVTDPEGPSSGSLVVFRGGAWDTSAAYCRAAYRGRLDPLVLSDSHGFRVALSLPTTTSEPVPSRSK